MTPIYQHYLDRAVRDLAWTLDGQQDLLRVLPPFGRFECFTPADDLADWLDHVCRHPKRLHTWLEQCKSRRLGLYFEQLIAFYLQEHPGPGPRLWKRSVPIRTAQSGTRGAQTLGELDFLLVHDQSVTHLEVAVKFYLGHNGDWLGPNARDSWAAKRNRMAHHQLPLSDALAPSLTSLAVSDKRFWVKGHLFRHWLRPCAWPEDTVDNKPCRWLYLAEVEAFLVDCSGPWVALERSEWLGGAGPAGRARALQPQALLRALQHWFAQDQRGMMLACGKPHCLDCERLFIVGDQWPVALAAE